MAAELIQEPAWKPKSKTKFTKEEEESRIEKHTKTLLSLLKKWLNLNA